MIYKLTLQKDSSPDLLWEKLEIQGAEPLYAEETDEESALILRLDATLLSQLLEETAIAKMTPYELPEIDWDNQWETHAPGYAQGHLQIQLDEYGGPEGKRLSLLPGPGFGDLSHPTTRLVLRQLLPLASGKTVIDVGCGSGILSLCAAASGAQSVTGIDICREALTHAQANSQKNHLEIAFCTPNEFSCCPPKTLVVMNMIGSEQELAWSSLPALHANRGLFITSGILSLAEDSAIALYKKWGFHDPLITREEGWSCFTFRGET